MILNEKLIYLCITLIITTPMQVAMDCSRVFCATCKKEFSSRRYYKAHLQYKANKRCKAAWNNRPLETPQKRRHEPDEDVCDADIGYVGQKSGNAPLAEPEDHALHRSQLFSRYQNIAQSTQKYGVPNGADSDDDARMGLFGNDDDDASISSDDTQDEEEDEEIEPDENILQDFQTYCEYATNNTCHLEPEMEAGIELMSLLIKKRAPLNLFDKIFKWHVKNLEAVSHKPKRTLMQELQKRYNMAKK